MSGERVLPTLARIDIASAALKPKSSNLGDFRKLTYFGCPEPHRAGVSLALQPFLTDGLNQSLKHSHALGQPGELFVRDRIMRRVARVDISLAE